MDILRKFFNLYTNKTPARADYKLDSDDTMLTIQQDRAKKLYETDSLFAFRIAMGDEKAPDGILPAAVYGKVCDEIEKISDIDKCMELANSFRNNKISADSKRLKFRSEDAPIEKMKEVVWCRIKEIEKKLPKGVTFDDFLQKEVQKMKENFKEEYLSSTKEAISDFFDSLERDKTPHGYVMDFEFAEKVMKDYGGFIECLKPRLFTIFFHCESVLPYAPGLIEDALNITAKYYHEKGDRHMVESIHTCLACLIGYENDEKALTMMKTFENKKMYDCSLQLIKEYRKNNKFYVEGFFKDTPFNKLDFDNLNSYNSDKVLLIYGAYLKHAHLPLSYLFRKKIPESLLSFSKEDFAKALTFQSNICRSRGEREDAEALELSKERLNEYVDDETALKQFIKNFSDKVIRDSIISNLKELQEDLYK